jgi:hypothetical protein
MLVWRMNAMMERPKMIKLNLSKFVAQRMKISSRMNVEKNLYIVNMMKDKRIGMRMNTVIFQSFVKQFVTKVQMVQMG